MFPWCGVLAEAAREGSSRRRDTFADTRDADAPRNYRARVFFSHRGTSHDHAKARIADFYGAGGFDETVRRLEVAMQNAGRVRRFETGGGWSPRAGKRVSKRRLGNDGRAMNFPLVARQSLMLRRP